MTLADYPVTVGMFVVIMIAVGIGRLGVDYAKAQEAAGRNRQAWHGAWFMGCAFVIMIVGFIAALMVLL